MMKLKKNGYPYFMIDFEAKAAAQNFALVLKTAEWEGPLPAHCGRGAGRWGGQKRTHLLRWSKCRDADEAVVD